MAREIKVFISDRWVSAKYKGSDEESKDLAALLYTMITDFNILTRVGSNWVKGTGHTLHVQVRSGEALMTRTLMYVNVRPETSIIIAHTFAYIGRVSCLRRKTKPSAYLSMTICKYV